jgi:DNA-binding winged helix-turn-helix (wHTH) protein
MIYAFGEFEVDDHLFELRRLGARLPIQRRTLDLLLYLLRQRDRVVPRRELVEHVWGSVAVTDNAIAQAITCVRRAIEVHRGPQAVVTIRGRGYRFTRSVVEERARSGSARRSLEPRVIVLAEPVRAEGLDASLDDAALAPRFFVDAGEESCTPLGAWSAFARAAGAPVPDEACSLNPLT